MAAWPCELARKSLDEPIISYASVGVMYFVLSRDITAGRLFEVPW